MKSLLGRFSVKLNTELAAVPIEEGPRPEVVTIPLTGGGGYNVTVDGGESDHTRRTLRADHHRECLVRTGYARSQ